MIIWALAGTNEGYEICSYSMMTVLRNWAAYLDDDLPVFFDMSPWEGTVPADKVPQLVEEIELMLRKPEGLPEGGVEILQRMLRAARAAAERGVAIEVE